MCRLFAITATMDKELKADLVERMMFFHAMEGQKNGWGITDGASLWRGAGLYGPDPSWKSELGDGLVMTHVRQASSDTGLTVSESHPFNFPGFLAAHNGTFRNTGISRGKMADSDSYRIFQQFSNMYGNDITAQNISKWLTQYWQGSSFAFMFLKQNTLFFLRNHHRSLSIAPIGDGYVVATSPDALQMLRVYAKNVHELIIGADFIVTPGRLYTLKQGDTNIIQESLTYALQAVPFQVKAQRFLKKRIPFLK